MKPILILILTVFSIKLNAQSKTDFIADHMLSANIHVLSSYKDTAAIGGFATSDIKPMNAFFLKTFNQKGFFLFIDTTSKTTFKGKYKGFDFFIVNKSDSTVKFDASDSTLDILAEAYVLDEWKRIEYFPQSFCGNSYHKIFLKRNHYWKITVPKYCGELPVLIRYRMQIDGIDYLYSNTYCGGINITQMIAPEKFEW